LTIDYDTYDIDLTSLSLLYLLRGRVHNDRR